MVWFSAVVFDRSRDWTWPIPGLLGGFLGSAGVIWLQRRRLGGRERMREYDRALRTGRLPDDADPAVWRPLLERERQAQRRAMGFSYGVVGVLGLCWVLVAVLYDVSPVWWPLAVLVLALFAAFLRWAGNRQARRIRRLLEQVPHAAAD